MASLEYPVLKNVETGQLIEVCKSPFTFGRTLTSDYVIEDNTISRTHCSIVKSDEGWVLRDTSTNGTFVNGDIYSGTTSCVLKNNDEICLGYRSYTYKFLIENSGAPNPQVEMLRSEGSETPDGILGNSPASVNSFDDNGISDDVLNNLADNILNNIKEPPEQLNGVYRKDTDIQKSLRETSGNSEIINNAVQGIIHSLEGNSSRQGNYEFNNIIDPVELMLKPTQFCANANQPGCSNTDLQQVVETGSKRYTDLEQMVQDNNAEKSMLRDLLHENSNSNDIMTSSNSKNNSNNIMMSSSGCDNSNGIMMSIAECILQQINFNPSLDLNKITANAEELPSSGSTIIYASPGGSNFNPLPAGVDQNVAESSANNNYVPAVVEYSYSIPGSSLGGESNNGIIQDSVERFKIHFDQTLDEVIRKYTVPDEGSNSSSSTTTTSNPVTSVSGILGNSFGEFNAGTQSYSNSLSNSSHMAIVSPLNVNKKVKVTSSATTHSSRHPPIVTTISYNTSGVIVSTSNHNASTTRLPTSTVSYSTKTNREQTVSASRNVSRPVYASNFGFSLTQPPPSTSRINALPYTVVVPDQNRRVVPKNATNLDVIDLTNSQDYLTSTAANAPTTSVSAGYGVPIGSTATGSVLSYRGASPSANHEMVDGSSTGTTGDNVAAPSNNLHISQKPGTSEEADKGDPSKLQTIAQNQYEEMENELMCTICANLFIKAVTLGCSHSFCQYCIEAWKKKKSDCPICRKPMTSSIRTLVLDNIIEKMLENAPLEDRKQRKESVEERQKIEDAEKAAKNKKKKKNKRDRNRARRERSNARNNNDARGVNNVRAVVAAPQPPPQPPPQPTHVIQIIDTGDSSATTDSDEDGYGHDYDYDNYYDDEWYNGVEGAYYGGYGRCYICGNQGHWANGCPLR